MRNMQSIRVRTGYSFRAATGHPEEVIARLVEVGAEFAPITDRASTFGWVKWNKAAKKANLKPVFGVELAVSPDPSDKKPVFDYWTFIAKDDTKEINRLVALATAQFRYVPLLSYEQALSSDCFKIIGHRSSIEKLTELMVAETDHGRMDTGYENGVFYALAPAMSKGYMNALNTIGIPPVAASDNVFIRPENEVQAQVLLGMGYSSQSYPQHILDGEEWVNSIARLGLAEDTLALAEANSRWISETSTASLQPAELMVPEKPFTLREMSEQGAVKLGINLKDEVYKQRLDRELALVAEKGYEDYFYIVADLVNWARERMLVGPARGSSCGSLLCYLIGITTVDPIPYGLLFERFVDINRTDMPDIDIDFADSKRHLVEEYAAEKYGLDKVARLGTVSMFKARSALQTICAELRVPRWKADRALDSLIERSSGDARALDTLADTLNESDSGKSLIKDHPEILQVLPGFEGHPRHAGQHAAGIVISRSPISDTVAIDSRTGATQCDKKDAEDLNLLKIDALGLTQLSIFEDCLELANLPKNFLETIPLDDPAAFDVLNKGQYAGIFQYMGQALQSIGNSIKNDCLEDIISTTALARPGPMASGGTNEWIRRRTGSQEVSYPHPCFEPYLNQSLGIVIYQEQVMMIGREIGDLSWGDVTALRKAMSKSLGKEFFDQFGDRWKVGALAKGVPKEKADKIWDDLCAYGSWSFNRSHSVAYGIISYQCCYLKAHYPLEFAAATLQHMKDPDAQLKMLREIVLEGNEYIPVLPDQSTDKWGIGEKDGKRILIGPLQNIKGIGPKSVVNILRKRASGEPITGREAKLLENPKTELDSLFPIRDAFLRAMPDPTERNIHTKPTPIIHIQALGNNSPDEEHLVFCILSDISPRSDNDAQKVAQRGYKVKGPDMGLNLRLTDDTDTIFGKVNRYNYEKLGAPIVERGAAGKHLYVIKGGVKSGFSFRMLNITAVRYIGPIED